MDKFITVPVARDVQPSPSDGGSATLLLTADGTIQQAQQVTSSRVRMVNELKNGLAVRSRR